MKSKDIEPVTLHELKKSLSQINTGKSPNSYGLVVEHITYAGESAMKLLLSNSIFEAGMVPDSLKPDLLPTIYKN